MSSVNQSIHVPFLEIVGDDLQYEDICQLMAPGKYIGCVQVGEPMNEECNSSYDHSAFLGEIFDGAQQSRLLQQVFFTSVGEYMTLGEVKTPSGKEATICVHEDGLYMDEDTLTLLREISEEANFGDMMTQSTRIDHGVRRGKQISLENNDKITIFDGVSEDFKSLFSKTTGIYDVIVRPYKINIYENGDFFSEHADSPENGLLATMILNLHGQTSSMTIAGKSWSSNIDHGPQNDVAIFWTNVLHKVDPVVGSRVSMTFKVFSNNRITSKEIRDTTISHKASSSKMLDAEATSTSLTEQGPIVDFSISKLLVDRLTADPKKSHYILLQNGYAYINSLLLGDQSDTSVLNVMKGADRHLLKAAIESFGSTHDWFLMPVVTELVQIDRREGYESSDGDYNWTQAINGNPQEDADEFRSEDEEDEQSYRFFSTSYNGWNGKHESQYGFSVSKFNIHMISEALKEKIIWSDEGVKHSVVTAVSPNEKGRVPRFRLSCPKTARSWRRIHCMSSDLDSGYLVGQQRRKNCYIGNNYSGRAIDNIYLDMLLVINSKHAVSQM